MKIYFIILLSVIGVIDCENNYKKLIRYAINVEIKYRVRSRRLDIFLVDLMRYREPGMEYDQEYEDIVNTINYLKDKITMVIEDVLHYTAGLTRDMDEILSKFPPDFKSSIPEEEPEEAEKSSRNKRRKIYGTSKRQDESAAADESLDQGAGPSSEAPMVSSEEFAAKVSLNEPSGDDWERGPEPQGAEAAEPAQKMETDSPKGLQHDSAQVQPTPPPMASKYDRIDESMFMGSAELEQIAQASLSPLAAAHDSPVDFAVFSVYRSALELHRRHFASDLDLRLLSLLMYRSDFDPGLPSPDLHALNVRRVSLKGRIESRLLDLFVSSSKYSTTLPDSEKLRLLRHARGLFSQYQSMLLDYEGLLAVLSL